MGLGFNRKSVSDCANRDKCGLDSNNSSGATSCNRLSGSSQQHCLNQVLNDDPIENPSAMPGCVAVCVLSRVCALQLDLNVT